jgi:fluoroquinolone transport system permease protein
MINRDLYLVKGDWKIIGRDPMLFLCMFAPVLLLLIVLIAFPLISDLTEHVFNFPLQAYFPIGRLFIFPLASMLFGMAYGFMLLDERDGGLISYLAITPLGKSGYLEIRMLMPVFLSFIMNILYLAITGFTQLLSMVEIVTISVITSFEAPLVLLLLGAFAGNKVEGMAISKGIGIILLPMVVDYLLTGNWRWIMSISPLWWIERAVFANPDYRWFYLTGAAVVHFIFIALLFRKFNKRFG